MSARRQTRPVAICGVLLLLSSLAACGKKGPPLAPLRVAPGRIEDLTLAKAGNDVHARFTLPVANDNKSQPVDVVAAELYAISGKPEDPTGQPLSGDEFLRLADLVGRIEVKPVPEEGKAPPSAPAAPQDTRPSPGEVATITERLSATFKPFVHPRARQATKPAARPDTEAVVRPLGWPPPEDTSARVYVVVSVNSKGHRSSMSNRVTLPLLESPQPVPAPTVTHNVNTIGVSWVEAPGSRRDLQRAPAPGELVARPLVQGPPGTAYNVYAATRRDGEFVIGSTPVGGPTPGLAYGLVLERFGEEKCFAVRAVRTFGAARLESEPSPVACITPTDTFPPEAPKNLVAVGSEGGVSLIWDSNTEKDLAGYLVMRGEVGPGGTAGALAPLMSQPIRETTYRDTTARAGTRYIYAVVAVDSSTPPNVSAESNRVEEGAR